MSFIRFSEGELRAWLKSIWPKDRLQWIEQARGGSVGFPDALLGLPGGEQLPLELKLWKEGPNGVRCPIRPAQIRWHTKRHLSGGRSALLFGVDSGKDYFDIYVMPGHSIPRRPTPTLRKQLAMSLRDVGRSDLKKNRLEFVLLDDNFWKSPLFLVR